MNSGPTLLDEIDVDPEIRALLPTYIRRRVSDVNTIRDLLLHNDVSEIRRLAHNMRGSGEAYGLPQITDIGAKMEEAALSCDTEQVDSLIDRLEKFISQLQ